MFSAILAIILGGAGITFILPYLTPVIALRLSFAYCTLVAIWIVIEIVKHVTK